MKKKLERKLKKEEIRKKLEEAIELKLAKMKEYRETPSKKHLEDVVAKLEVEDDASALVILYNKKAQTIRFNGVKCNTSDLVAMTQYVFAKAVQNDVGGVMDCVSTVARQAELNECWTEHHEEEKEIKDGAEESK